MALNSVQDPNSIGNVLMQMGLVNLEALKEAVWQQMQDGGARALGAILTAMGMISPVDLEVGLRIQALLRAGDEMGAKMAIIEYHTERIASSLQRQTATVEAVERALDNKDS